MSTWSGMSSVAWSDNGNWDNPPAGNDLVFPSGASNPANTNDLAAGTAFGSVTIAGSGYTIGGNAVVLGGGIDASQGSSTSTVGLPITFSGTPTVKVDQSGAGLILSGPISGSSGLTKDGAGVLVLSGANDYTGTTAVDAGTLQVDDAQGGSPVTLSTGTQLSGVGTVGTITSTGGTISPGDSAPGILTDSGDLNLDSASTFDVALDGTEAGTGYNQLTVAGDINLAGATLNATAGFTPTGNASFTIIKNTGESPVSGTFAGLPEGAVLTIAGASYRISYAGGTDGQDVVLTHLATSTTSISSSASGISFGQTVNLTATVASGDSSLAGPPTGTVIFFSGTTALGPATTLTGGVATMDNVSLPTGTAQITAQYQGDGNFATSTSSATSVTVAEGSTMTSVAVSPNPSNLGASVTLTATVVTVSPASGTPTGTVEFFSAGASLGTGTLSASGVATLSTTTLKTGANSITATYQGDTNFDTSSSTAMTATVLAPATTTVSSSASSVALGQTVTLTATVVSGSTSTTATPTGNVQFFSGTTSLGTAAISGGVATLVNATLPFGTDSITANYQGDSNFSSSTSSAITVTVTQGTSTTTFSISPNPAVVGQSVTLTASVSGTGGTPTGTVQFFNGTTSLGTVTLVSGTASLTTSALPQGLDSITATYSGDSQFTASSAAASTAIINQAGTTTTLSVPSTSVPLGQAVTLTASVAAVSPGAGTPTGPVQFLSNSIVLGTATLDGNGNATFTTTGLGVGVDTITAVYQGDANFTTSTASAANLTVNQGTATVSLSGLNTVNPADADDVEFTITVTPQNGAATPPTGTVVVFDNGTYIGSRDIQGGQAVFDTYDLDVGSHVLTAVYQGDSNFGASSISVPLTLTVGTKAELALNQLYLSVLHRPVDSIGLALWEPDMATAKGRREVLLALEHSPEARALQAAEHTTRIAKHRTR
jgi:autotransporter-associated beta strand protein